MKTKIKTFKQFNMKKHDAPKDKDVKSTSAAGSTEQPGEVISQIGNVDAGSGETE